VNSWWSKV